MIYALLYFIGISERVHDALFTLGIILTFITIVWLSGNLFEAIEKNPKSWFYILTVSLLLMSAAIPEKSSLLAMAGIYGLEQMSSSNDGKKIKELIFNKIDEELKNDGAHDGK